MAKTATDVQLLLAYRLGENAVPNNSSELARRLSYIQSAIEFVTLDKPYWFLKQKVTDDTVADQEEYDFPARVFKIDEVKVDGYQHDKIARDEIYDKFEAPTAVVPILPSYMQRSYYLWNDKAYFIPTPTTNGSANIVYWCYQNPDLSAFVVGSSIIVPDEFINMIASYAEFRYWSAAHKRGKAADAEGEFRDYLGRLTLRNERLKYGQ